MKDISGMIGADTLIPARFLTLLGHLCVLITLLWEAKQTAKRGVPRQRHGGLFLIDHSQLVMALGASVVLVLAELLIFIYSLTMLSVTISPTSIFAHVVSTIVLLFCKLNGWNYECAWIILLYTSAPPFMVDMLAAGGIVGTTKLLRQE